VPGIASHRESGGNELAIGIAASDRPSSDDSHSEGVTGSTTSAGSEPSRKPVQPALPLGAERVRDQEDRGQWQSEVGRAGTPPPDPGPSS
jgi:hypothetical protein